MTSCAEAAVLQASKRERTERTGHGSCAAAVLGVGTYVLRTDDVHERLMHAALDAMMLLLTG